MTLIEQVKGHWGRCLAEAEPALREVAGRGCVLLHGSLMRGVVDEVADFDLWILAPGKAVARFDEGSDTRFVQLPLMAGRAGHVTVEAIEEMKARVDACEVAWIDELRLARVVTEGPGAELVERCQRRMPEEVRRGLFMHHYVEFRSEDRAMDNPIRRRDGVAMLIAGAAALEQAMRAGLVLEGKTYPYKKWLGRAFRESAVGERCWPEVERLLGALTPEGYGKGGDERQHAASLAMRAVRGILIEEAEGRGLGGRYLREWWLELTAARRAREGLRWG